MGGHVTGDPQVYDIDRILFEIAFLFLIYTRRIICNYSKSFQILFLRVIRIFSLNDLATTNLRDSLTILL